jgi:hypothetical protein
LRQDAEAFYGGEGGSTALSGKRRQRLRQLGDKLGSGGARRSRCGERRCRIVFEAELRDLSALIAPELRNHGEREIEARCDPGAGDAIAICNYSGIYDGSAE